MDYFFRLTADEQPVTIALDDGLDLALVVLGCDPEAPSWSGPPRQVLAFADDVELFDAREAWALWATIREHPDWDRERIVSAAVDLVEPWQRTTYAPGGDGRRLIRISRGWDRPAVTVERQGATQEEADEFAEALREILNERGW